MLYLHSILGNLKNTLGIGGIKMDKNEILQKSRHSKQDEGMEFVENKGRKVGFTIFCCIFVGIVLFNAFLGNQDQAVFYAVASLFWAFLAGEAYPKFKFTGNKSSLITVIASGIATIASLANFILISLR